VALASAMPAACCFCLVVMIVEVEADGVVDSPANARMWCNCLLTCVGEDHFVLGWARRCIQTVNVHAV
jgi:hypothetical protein